MGKSKHKLTDSEIQHRLIKRVLSKLLKMNVKAATDKKLWVKEVLSVMMILNSLLPENWKFTPSANVLAVVRNLKNNGGNA